MNDIDRQCISTIRMLAADMVEAANSGHPGLPLGAAPMAYLLFNRVMKHNPKDPKWANRDRFVLSAGHGSALLYAMLHLTGYDLSLDECKNFRQWNSLTPGHPEYGHTPGVEATTGPLGQGFAMGVGMALAQRFLAHAFNKPGHQIIDHNIYAIVSDGDLMEGITSEAASIAGHMGLGKIIYLYDDNKISIEGSTDLAFTEDVAARFDAYNWHVQEMEDVDDLAALEAAIQTAQAETGRPSLIIVPTSIGFGSPKQDQASAHGEPLGAEAMAATRKFYGWPDEPFTIPQEALTHLRRSVQAGDEMQTAWQAALDSYGEAFPAEVKELGRALTGALPKDYDAEVPVFKATDGKIATRAASGKVLNGLAAKVPEIVGGSADLAPSNKTMLAGFGDLGADEENGRNIHFGVREHAMGAMVNGMALHGGVIPYGGTFLIFSDYLRPALRLAALMRTRSIFVFTHDSIGVGEDGPTHQPIEQVASLRAMPGMHTMRPADANETAAAWRWALHHQGPTCLCLTRQKLAILDPVAHPIDQGLPMGAYILSEEGGDLDIILIASGSEVHLALAAQAKLAAEGVGARVVSMPCWELFAKQKQEYKDSVLPPTAKKRLAVEAGSSFGWREWVGDAGEIIAIDRFGHSAPGGLVMEHYGMTVDNVYNRAKALLAR